MAAYSLTATREGPRFIGNPASHVNRASSISPRPQRPARHSGMGTSVSKEKEEEWDKEIPSVSLLRVFALNSKEWWLILLGVVGAILNGAIYPVLCYSVWRRSSLCFAMPASEIVSSIGLWAGLFLVLGVCLWFGSVP